METVNSLVETSKVQEKKTYAPGSRGFDWVVSLLSLWLVLGMYVDGSVHHHVPEVVDSFFTPWHAFLYTGFLAAATSIFFQTVWNMRKGYSFQYALPGGYFGGLLGALVFALGGVGDMMWHEIFGTEEGVDALLSPTHLLLGVGAILIVSTPFLAAWHRLKKGDGILRWHSEFPALLSLTFSLSVLTFFTEYLNILGFPNLLAETPVASQEFFWSAQGVAGVLVPTALFSGLFLMLMKRWRLTAGSFMIILLGNHALMTIFHFEEVTAYPQTSIAILFATVIIELLYIALKPLPDNLSGIRLFSFLMPVTIFSMFFASMVVTSSIWWTVHMWTGTAFLAGIVGLMLSYLALQPSTQN